jgi:hypothetical protein
VAGGGVNINLADIATFTAGAQYTQGLATRWMNQLDTTRVACDRFVDVGLLVDVPEDCDLQDAFGVTAGLTFNVNDTTSINIEGGYAQNIDAEDNVFLTVDNVVTVHGNILWQPVKQMRLGWEAMWGRNEFVDDRGVFNADGERIGKVCAVIDDDDKCVDNNDALRFQFGAWFFF